MASFQMCRTTKFRQQGLSYVCNEFLRKTSLHLNIERFLGSASCCPAVLNVPPMNYVFSNRITHESKFRYECLEQQVRKFAKKAIIKESKGKGKLKVYLSDEELNEVIDVAAYHNQLKEVINKMKTNFAEHISLHKLMGNIDNLPVKIENEEYPLNELAKITRKTPNLVAIDMSVFPEGLKPALQAISESGMGINPQQEGTTIFLPLPKITKEHREKLVKNAKTVCTKTKEEIRAVQNMYIKQAKMKTELSEDLVFNTQQQVMHIAEQCAAEAEKLLKLKQEELLPKS